MSTPGASLATIPRELAALHPWDRAFIPLRVEGSTFVYTSQPRTITDTAVLDDGRVTVWFEPLAVDAGGLCIYAADLLPAGALLVCPSCDGRGWDRLDPEGDHTRAWIEACIVCGHFSDDEDAAEAAARATGTSFGCAVPPARDDYTAAERERLRPLEPGPHHAYLIGVDPDTPLADLIIVAPADLPVDPPDTTAAAATTTLPE